MMSTVSFFLLPKKSSRIEQNRFHKHTYVKQDESFSVYARFVSPIFKEGQPISKDYSDFLQLISDEMHASFHFVFKELKIGEGEQDFPVQAYLNSKKMDISNASQIINDHTAIGLDVLYEYPYDEEK